MAEAAEVVPGAPPAPPPDRETARRWIGAKLEDAKGSPVGRVLDVLVDAEDGVPAWMVAKIGLLGGRSAVPAAYAAEAAGRVWVPWDTETIRSARRVDASDGLSCGEEARLAEIYALAERPPCSGADSEAVASVPLAGFGSASSE